MKKTLRLLMLLSLAAVGALFYSNSFAAAKPVNPAPVLRVHSIRYTIGSASEAAQSRHATAPVASYGF